MATALQRTRAIRLYRHSLKNMLSWAVRREVFYEEVRPGGTWGGARRTGREGRGACKAAGRL